jgi:hypothetical protein
VPTLDLERQLLREYIDLPGLSLTLPQVSRLLSAETPTCRAVLNSLEDAGCLRCTADGKYVRMTRHDGLHGWIRHARHRLTAPTPRSTMMPSRVTTFETRRRTAKELTSQNPNDACVGRGAYRVPFPAPHATQDVRAGLKSWTWTLMKGPAWQTTS